MCSSRILLAEETWMEQKEKEREARGEEQRLAVAEVDRAAAAAREELAAQEIATVCLHDSAMLTLDRSGHGKQC
jgi:uncharacterized membrane-anchored protein